MKLSANFWLYEFTRSQQATRYSIDNQPDAEALEELRALVANILQPLRDMVNLPINVSSGYRSPELNEIVKGAKKSQHMKGQAADIECFGMSNPALAKIIFDHFRYDQLILEFHYPERGPDSGWIHVSHKRNGDNRQKTIRAYKNDDGKTIYEPVTF